MGYQSKTYSLSDEVVAAIDAKRAEGITPDQYLWALIFKTAKLSKRQVADNTITRTRTYLDAVGPDTSTGRGKATTEIIERKPPLKSKEKK